MLKAVGPATSNDPAGEVQALRRRSRISRFRIAHALRDGAQGALFGRERRHDLKELPLPFGQSIENAMDMRFSFRGGLTPTGFDVLARNEIVDSRIPSALSGELKEERFSVGELNNGPDAALKVSAGRSFVERL